MIYAKNGVKEQFEKSSVSITGDMTLNGREITSISTADILKLEVGMVICHANFPNGTFIENIYSNYIEVDKQSSGALSSQTIYAGNGLDIFFREIEKEFGTTLKRWKYLDSKESVTLQHPSIEILGTDIRTTYLNDDSPDFRAWDEHGLSIRIVNSGNNINEVGDWILYCREAIRRLINHDYTFQEKFESVVLDNADLSDMYKMRTRNDFLQILEQGIYVKSIASY